MLVGSGGGVSLRQGIRGVEIEVVGRWEEYVGRLRQKRLGWWGGRRMEGGAVGG